jgi:23S rRNA pseudouridine1911/1915/1917 synthase
MTLLDRLIEQFPTAKRQTFKQMLAHGRVVINDRRATRLNLEVKDDDVVRVLPRAQELKALPSLHPLKLVHEDDDILVIDKPAGLLTSTVASETRATALAIVRRYVAARSPKAQLGLIHRLDRDASGLLVFSKSHRAYKSLKTQFFKHSVERAYEAIVQGRPNPLKGRIESHLVERADGTVRSTPEVGGKAQRAITDYEVVEKIGKQSRLLVRLLTGRKHQIRVHLSERGCPIVGDQVYGSNTPGPLRLRAIRLVIDHPATGKRMAFDAVPL